MRHDAVAIAAHLKETLTYFVQNKTINSSINKIYFISDGPTNQYKNKNIIYLITQYVSKLFPQFELISYNFTAAGHGKSRADGVGGNIKRMADAAVLYGKDLGNFNDLYSFLKSKSKSVTILSVTPDMITSVSQILQNNAKLFKGTSLTHQYNWFKKLPQIVRFNFLSCFSCDKSEENCIHYTQGVLNYSNEKKTLKKIDPKKKLNNDIKKKINSNIPINKPKIKSVKIVNFAINKKKKNDSENCNSNKISKVVNTTNIKITENTNTNIRKSLRSKKSTKITDM